MKGLMILVLLGYLLLTFILFAGSMTSGAVYDPGPVNTMRTVLGLFAVLDVIAIIALAASKDEIPIISMGALLATPILILVINH